MSDAAKRDPGETLAEVQADSERGTKRASDRSAMETLLLVCCPHCQMAVEVGDRSHRSRTYVARIAGSRFRSSGPTSANGLPPMSADLSLSKSLARVPLGQYGGEIRSLTATWRSRSRDAKAWDHPSSRK